ERGRGGGGVAGGAAPRRVDGPAPRHRQEPRLRIVRNAVGRPTGERSRKRLRQRILGTGYVARTRGQEGDQLAVVAARHRLGGRARLPPILHCYMAPSGRTSLTPRLAPRPRPAPGSAAARSGTSRPINPPRCSL